MATQDVLVGTAEQATSYYIRYEVVATSGGKNVLAPAVLASSFAAAAAVTPHDTNALAVTSRALFVGTGGDVKVTIGGTDVTFANVPDGTRLDIAVTHVKSTGTTATNIVSLS